MNSIFSIVPRKMIKGPLWVFDDPDRGLQAEPFLEDASAALDKIAEKIGAVGEMVLAFSATEIPDATMVIERIGSGDHADLHGVLYLFEKKRVWLCPATTKYFPKPPEKIWLKAYRYA
jgi:hypothetical protein